MAWLAKTDEKSAILCQVETQETNQELFYHQMFEEEMKYQMHLEKKIIFIYMSSTMKNSAMKVVMQ
jgi:hypothetical protein